MWFPLCLSRTAKSSFIYIFILHKKNGSNSLSLSVCQSVRQSKSQQKVIHNFFLESLRPMLGYWPMTIVNNNKNYRRAKEFGIKILVNTFHYVLLCVIVLRYLIFIGLKMWQMCEFSCEDLFVCICNFFFKECEEMKLS